MRKVRIAVISVAAVAVLALAADAPWPRTRAPSSPSRTPGTVTRIVASAGGRRRRHRPRVDRGPGRDDDQRRRQLPGRRWEPSRRRSALSHSAARCCRSRATSSSPRRAPSRPHHRRPARAACRRSRRSCSFSRQPARRSTCPPTSCRRRCDRWLARSEHAHLLPRAAGHPGRQRAARRSGRSSSAPTCRSPASSAPSAPPAWIGLWTPWQAGNGQTNPAGTIASASIILPGLVTLKGKRVNGRVTLQGTASQGGFVAPFRVSVWGAIGQGGASPAQERGRERHRGLQADAAQIGEADRLPVPSHRRRGGEHRRPTRRISARAVFSSLPAPVLELHDQRVHGQVEARDRSLRPTSGVTARRRRGATRRPFGFLTISPQLPSTLPDAPRNEIQTELSDRPTRRAA